jgi:hypothetical protein
VIVNYQSRGWGVGLRRERSAARVSLRRTPRRTPNGVGCSEEENKFG